MMIYTVNPDIEKNEEIEPADDKNDVEKKDIVNDE